MFLLYFLLWLTFSMQLSIENTVVGIIISFAVYIFTCNHMRYRPSTDLEILRNLLRGIKYVLILVTEVARANIAVFRIVFKPVIQVEPQLICFRTKLKTNPARVVLANSITLTPGTITVMLSGDLFYVHCLNSEMAKDIDDSMFIRQLKKFED